MSSTKNSILGDWTSQVECYAKEFQSARPFEHVVIKDFLDPELADFIARRFPTPFTQPMLPWHHYDNPLEQKFALNDFDSEEISIFKNIFQELQQDSTLELVRAITGIQTLEADPFLHGAGIHAYPSGGKLDMHLDYSIHPHSGKERRVNIIYYLNPEWDQSWGGQLELRDKNLSVESKRMVDVGYNSAILFRTCDDSFHGLPTPIRCPQNQYRKSLAIYYVSEPRVGAAKRYKAQYYPLPEQSVSDALKRLYDVRTKRLLTPEDLATLGPNWREEGKGYW